MFFSTKVIALFSALSAGAFAADVYSAFLDANGAEIGDVQFDVSNTGCFTVPGAVQVSFSQGGLAGSADGPYCLTGYANSGCSGSTASQQFQNVGLTGQKYHLNDGLSNTGSYTWSPNGC